MNSRGLRRRSAGTAAFLGAVLAAMGLLWLLAGILTSAELRHRAGVELAAWRAGASPWQWTLAQPGDVVAGRAFGDARLQSMATGLGLISADGTAFEIGLPLPRDADLVHAPRLRVRIHAAPGTRAWLVIRQRADSPLCQSAVNLAAAGATTWSLPALDWRQPDGTRCSPPTRAAMLRIRLRQPAGTKTLVREAGLLPAGGSRPVESTSPLHLPADLGAATRLLDSTQTAHNPAQLPLIRLPDATSPPRLLALRDLAHDALPAAIVLPATGSIPTSVEPAPAPGARFARIGAVLFYGLVLLALVLRPPPSRWRPLAEITAAMLGPLWLIAGLHLDQRTDPMDMTACILGLLFAAALQWRSRPRDWRWSGDLSAWLQPLALLPLALALALWPNAEAHALHTPDARRALVYLMWACLQQWLMLTVVLKRLLKLLPVAVAILVCALMFATLHTPNATLMQLCLLAELWWAWCFARSRALLPVALAHALCALALQASLTGTDTWLRSLEVSARYLGG